MAVKGLHSDVSSPVVYGGVERLPVRLDQLAHLQQDLVHAVLHALLGRDHVVGCLQHHVLVLGQRLHLTEVKQVK